MEWEKIFEQDNKLHGMMIEMILQAFGNGCTLNLNEPIRCCWFNNNGELTEFHIKWLLLDPQGLLKKEDVSDPMGLYAMLHFPKTAEDWLYPLTTELLNGHIMQICQSINDGEYTIN